MRLGFTECESTSWRSHTSVLCKTPSGVSTSLRLVLTMGTQISSLSNAVSYDLWVNGEDRFYGAYALSTNHPVSINASVSLLGQGFGLTSIWTPIAQIGLTACSATNLFSDSSIACKTVTVVASSLATTFTIHNMRFQVTGQV